MKIARATNGDLDSAAGVTGMKERPILFNAQMVRALLAGTKTQTRRVVKPEGAHHLFPFLDLPGNPTGEWAWCSSSHVVSQHVHCPYGQPGDGLWVRETWAPRTLGAWPTLEKHMKPLYRADEDRPEWRGIWKPSIHMPRWASRITLEIVSVRVERLQDISEADAKAEGIQALEVADKDGRRHLGVAGGAIDEPTYVRAYRKLWEQINGPGSWDANPWVWVVEFKRVQK